MDTKLIKDLKDALAMAKDLDCKIKDAFKHIETPTSSTSKKAA